ncbi:hypothetical protein F5051DRAFT_140440 [Lentinula edodes]|nr:hypothetical protein F5051DRAFT_140440 [Lentinula edodes]
MEGCSFKQWMVIFYLLYASLNTLHALYILQVRGILSNLPVGFKFEVERRENTQYETVSSSSRNLNICMARERNLVFRVGLE